MKRRITEIILIFILSLIVISALGISMALHSFTIIEWWKPVAICAILALPATFWLARYMKRLTRNILDYLEYPTAFVFSFSILLVAFYSSNFFLSDHNSGFEYDAPIVKKYSQERKRTYKVGRRGYRETKYRVYIIEIEMNDGKTKTLEKPLGEYNKIKRGGSVKMIVEDGLFKIPVIKPIPKFQKESNNIPN